MLMYVLTRFSIWKPSTNFSPCGRLYFSFWIRKHTTLVFSLLFFALLPLWSMMQSLARELFMLLTAVFGNMLLVSSPANCLSYCSSEQMPVISTVSAMAVWTALTIRRSKFPSIQTSLKWIPVMTDPAQVPVCFQSVLCSRSIISSPLRSQHNRTCFSLLQTHQKSLGESLFFTVGVKRHHLLFSRFQSFLFFLSTQ